MKKAAFITLMTCILLNPGFLQAQGRSFNLDETYSISPEGTIELTSGDADVFITGADRKDVHVKIRRHVVSKGLVWGDEDFGVNIFEENGNLTIKERSSSSYISIVGYMREDYTIRIEAPFGVNLNIKGDDGDYEIKNINGSIDMNIDDGDTQITNCGGSDFRFRFDDGDIYMDKGAGNLFVKADDGDLDIRNASFTTINASVDDGDITIQTSLADSGEYFFRASDADIILHITQGGGAFDIMHDDTRVSSEGPFKQTERDEHETHLTLPNGDARVKIRADDARIRLVANN